MTWPSTQKDAEVLRKRIAPELRLRWLRAHLIYLFEQIQDSGTEPGGQSPQRGPKVALQSAGKVGSPLVPANPSVPG